MEYTQRFVAALRRPAASAAVVALVTLLLTRFLVKLISHRSHFRKLQAQGMPMPPHSLVFGHIPVVIQVTQMLPSDAHLTHLPYFIRKTYNLGPNFYLDLWPLSPNILTAGSPETLHQVSTKYALPKNDTLKHFLKPLTDGLDIVSMNGPAWKKWRTVFNPGFSPTQLMKLVPKIVRSVEIYCEQLDMRVTQSDVFTMKSLTDNLTVDVIGEVTLGVKLDCQTTPNPVIRSLRTQIKWMSTGLENNLFSRYNPIRPLVQWYHGNVVNRYISMELDQRIENWQKFLPNKGVESSQTITDLALQAYTELQSNDRLAIQDPSFKKICSSQIKIFLFAGHDTTSSGICFNLWLLSQNSGALARIRQEHDAIFGPDPSKAAQMITDDPHLLAKLHYTNAVIKESLRHFTPVTSTRAGEIGVNLVDSDGRIFPTANMIVWCDQYSIHRDASYWASPQSFMPERWLADSEDTFLHPPKGMWRPFEHGPRSCLGQELAMIEMRIVLVLVCRTYNFIPAYDDFNKFRGKGKDVLGTKAYQVDIMQPRDDLPIRVEHL